MANANPSMDNGEKFRRSSCFTPSAARWSSSFSRDFLRLVEERRRVASMLLTIPITSSKWLIVQSDSPEEKKEKAGGRQPWPAG